MPDYPVHPLVIRAQRVKMACKDTLIRRERALLVGAAALFVVVITAIAAWKLWAFGYNALDLAIYRQVAANSIRGHLFAFTIHPHSYLGDHLELLFAVLFPIYAAFRNPLTLVVIQASALAVSVFPLAAVLKRILPQPWHLLFAFGFLANPVVQNMSLYEFHMLPFSIPILSLALLAYIDRRFSRFILFALLACLVREDIAFAIFGFGILALVDRRRWHWSILPLLLGSGWLVIALKITAHFNGYGHYKFLAYYGWLGQSIPEIAKNVFVHIDTVLLHIVSLPSLSFLAALLLPAAFLPLFKPRWLIPVVPSLLQFLLMQSPSELVVEIHYPSVFIPFLIVASAAAFASILNPRHRGVLARFAQDRAIPTIILITVILYTMVVIGPLAQSLPVIAKTRSIETRVSLERAFVASVPDGPAAAGYETITDLSGRPRVYSLHYQFLGRKQYSTESYAIPDDAQTVLVDLRDFLMYQLLYRLNDKTNRDGYRRIRDMLHDRGFILTAYADRFALFQTSGSPVTTALYDIGSPEHLSGTQTSHDDLQFLGWSTPSGSLQRSSYTIQGKRFTVVPISVTFEKRANNTSNDIDNLQFQFNRNGRVVYQIPLPLGGGMFPPSDWDMGQVVTSNYQLLIPETLAHDTLDLSATVYRSGGEVSLNGTRSLVIKYRNPSQLGERIEIATIQP